MSDLVLAPEALVVTGALGSLLVPALVSPRARAGLRRWLGWVAALVAAVALALELWQGGQAGTLLSGGFVQDRFALFTKAAALLALLVAILTADWEEETLPGALPLAFLAALGMMVAASAAGFVQLWAGLLLAVVAGGAALGRRVRGEAAGIEEAALRESAARSVLVAAGLAMLAGLAFALLAAEAGTASLAGAAGAMASHRVEAAGAVPAVVALGSLFALMVLAPLRFGVAAPAIGSPLGSGVAAAFSAGAAGVALLRAGAVLVPQASLWAAVLAGAAAILIAGAGLVAAGAGTRARTVVGALAASQLAWTVAGVAVHDSEGSAAAGLLLGAALAALAAAPVLLAELELGGARELLGLAARTPGRAAALVLAVLSLAGMPPLGGFAGQFLVGLAVLRSGYGPILALALLGTLLGWMGVFHLARSVYGAEAEEARALRAAASRRLLGTAWTAPSAAALLAGAVLLGYTLLLNPISGLAYQGAEALGLR